MSADEDRVTVIQARCTELLDEARLARRLLAVATDALKEISLCNDGKGLMPERAQRAYGLIAATGEVVNWDSAVAGDLVGAVLMVFAVLLLCVVQENES
jgi:hypothetical protein